MTQNKTALQDSLDRAELWQPSSNAKQCRQDYDRYVKAARAYADLPEKIEGMKVDVPVFNAIEQNDVSVHRAIERNQALDDILNLLKEGV